MLAEHSRSCATCWSVQCGEQRVACIHESANVHVADGNHAVEGRLHHLVILEPFQTGEARLRRFCIAPLYGDRILERLQRGKLRLVLGAIAIVILPRYHALRREAGEPLRRNPREFRIGLAALRIRERLVDAGLRLLERCFGLLNLLVQLRRLDLGKGWPARTASPMSAIRRTRYPSVRAKTGDSAIACTLPGNGRSLLPVERRTSVASTRGTEASCSCASATINAFLFRSGI
jgi:hypothetical protein